MWKYNPNYNIKFPNYPRIILPPLDIKKKNNISAVKKEDGINESLIYSNESPNKSINNDSFANYENSDQKDDGIRLLTLNNLVAPSLEVNKVNTSNLHLQTSVNNSGINTQENKENAGKEKKKVKTPFSKKNRALQFDKYSSRKPLEIPITNNIEYFIPETR